MYKSWDNHESPDAYVASGGESKACLQICCNPVLGPCRACRLPAGLRIDHHEVWRMAGLPQDSCQSPGASRLPDCRGPFQLARSAPAFLSLSLRA